MKTLKQNNLELGTTELGFVKTMNENIKEMNLVEEGTSVKLVREVELETGEKVQVESVTPHGMKKILNLVAGTGNQEIAFITPGENYDKNGTGENTKSGVVRMYNGALYNSMSLSLEDEGDITDPDESTDEGDSEDPENPDGENTDNNEDTTEE